MKHAKAEKDRLEREAKEEQTRRLELEAEVQRQAAERAEAEKLQAEKEMQQAQAFAEESRRKTRIAMAVGAIAFVFFVIAAATAWWANQERTRAEAMVRDAVSGELATKAESLFKEHPDQSSLLTLAAWHVSPIATAQAQVRAMTGEYGGQTVLRGHESRVSSAQFAQDGKTLVTTSDDQTARLWRCEVCRPIDELAAQLQRTIGRDLTDDERLRFGVPEWVSATK